MFKMREGTVAECKLYPITLGFGKKHRTHIGYPELARASQPFFEKSFWHGGMWLYLTRMLWILFFSVVRV
jgi:hypothetical protein